MKQIKKHKILSSIVIFLTIVIVITFLIIVPLLNEIKIKANDIQRKIVDYELDQARLAKLPDMEKRHAIFASHESSLDVIIGNDQEIELIKLLESLAEQTGNKVALQINDNLENKKSSKDKDKKDDLKLSLPYDKFIVMTLVLEGNYENFLNFLSKLENLKYYVNVTSVGLIKVEQESEEAVKSDKKENNPKVEILKSIVELVVYKKK